MASVASKVPTRLIWSSGNLWEVRSYRACTAYRHRARCAREVAVELANRMRLPLIFCPNFGLRVK